MNVIETAFTKMESMIEATYKKVKQDVNRNLITARQASSFFWGYAEGLVYSFKTTFHQHPEADALCSKLKKQILRCLSELDSQIDLNQAHARIKL